jgi:predicted O-methyltransferase YrrM
MIWVLVVANLVTLAVLVLAVRRLLRLRSVARQRGYFSPWPVRQITVDQLDARFTPGPFGMGPATQIVSITEYWSASTSDFEAWILCNFAKTARRMFEFGTATGRTAYLLALNSAEDSRLTTLTLSPEQAQSIDFAPSDDQNARKWAKAESQYERFVYEGTPAAGKIEQLFADSKKFDETPYLGTMDLIFVDGAHTESYVLSDSEKALRMLAPGGIIVWHDYRGPNKVKGAYAALNQLAGRLDLVHVRGTSMVFYRSPPETA